MAGFDFTIDTGEAMQQLNFLKDCGPAAQPILEHVGFATMAREINLEPVKTGNMRASTALTAAPGEVTITVNAPYAAAVNCNENAFHAIGQAHFAEAALQQIACSELPKQIAENLLGRMGLKERAA